LFGIIKSSTNIELFKILDWKHNNVPNKTFYISHSNWWNLDSIGKVYSVFLFFYAFISKNEVNFTTRRRSSRGGQIGSKKAENRLMQVLFIIKIFKIILFERTYKMYSYRWKTYLLVHSLYFVCTSVLYFLKK